MTEHNNEGMGETPGAGTGGGAFDNPAALGPGFPGTLGDMRFMGYTVIVVGVMNCLTIIGAILGVPLIISGRQFLDSAARFEEVRHGGGTNSLAAGFHDLGRSLRILKILVIIYIVLTVMYFIGLFFFGGLAMLAGLAESGGY